MVRSAAIKQGRWANRKHTYFFCPLPAYSNFPPDPKDFIAYSEGKKCFSVLLKWYFWHANFKTLPNILVKSPNRPRVFIPIFGRAIRTISISFAFPNRQAY